MIEIKRILAPSDFSLHSNRALRYAASIAERFQAELHLLHILPEILTPVGPEPMLVAELPLEYYAENEALALDTLKGLPQADWGKPASTQFAVRWGETVSCTLAYAQEIKADLLVISTHGRTGLSHALMGSVAERIVRESHCPVLTVRDPRKD